MKDKRKPKIFLLIFDIYFLNNKKVAQLLKIS